MKRLVIVGALATITICLFISCSNSKKSNNTTITSGQQEMTRIKSTSDLEYEILEEGSGANPIAGQQVTVHYTGWLDDNGKPGKKFDSSVDRGKPFVFYIGIGQVIKGWEKGVMGMKIGEKRRLFIPAELAYGAQGAGASIPPHANLIFDVELISIA